MIRPAIISFMIATPVAEGEPEIAPCVFTNSLTIEPTPSSAPWQNTVLFHEVDVDRVFWYVLHGKKYHGKATDPILYVIEDCAAGTDVVIYPWSDGDADVSVTTVVHLVLKDSSIGTEALVDLLATHGSNSWTRNAMAGNCVCEHHAMVTAQG